MNSGKRRPTFDALLPPAWRESVQTGKANLNPQLRALWETLRTASMWTCAQLCNWWPHRRHYSTVHNRRTCLRRCLRGEACAVKDGLNVVHVLFKFEEASLAVNSLVCAKKCRLVPSRSETLPLPTFLNIKVFPCRSVSNSQCPIAIVSLAFF